MSPRPHTPSEVGAEVSDGADVSTRVVTMTWVIGGALVISASVLAVGLLMSSLPGQVPTPDADMYGAAMTAVVGVLAGIAVFRTGARSGAEYQRVWRLCAVGFAAWSIGSLMIVGAHAGWLPKPFGDAGELGFLASVLLMTAGIVGHPHLGPRADRLRSFVDASIIAASTAMLIWFTAARSFQHATGDVLTSVVGMAFPTIETAVALVCLGLVVRAPRQSSSHAVGMMLAGTFAVFALGDTMSLSLRGPVGQRVPLLAEAPFVVGIAVLVLAARTSTSTHPMQLWAVDRRRLADGLAVAPATAAVVAGAATLVDGLAHSRLDPAAMLLLTAVIAMVLARQSLTLRDNEELSSSLKGTVARLERQATHDRLTGLPNRSGLAVRIADALDGATEDGRFAALCFVDVDHLKSVNDSLGHSAGDELLGTLARRLCEPEGAEVTRVGGDEFVVVVHDLLSREELRAFGEDVLRSAGRPAKVGGVSIRPSVSVGIAIGESRIETTELMRRADIALYRAKALGRGRVAIYDSRVDGESLRRLDLEPELRRALDQDEFEVYYQPVVELATGRMVKVEALLRWRHPTRGVLAPDAFLAEATASGLLGTIGERTLMTACGDFAPVPGRRDIAVSVNLSTTELTDRRVVDRVVSAVEFHGLDPEALWIEITEDVVVDDTIRRTIDELRAYGVRLAIDDFGTGNSSLRQLGSYPADTLKIDKSFIDRVDTDDEAAMITRAILGLARNLGLKTIAEGVERVEQAELLRDLGCDHAQGWLYAPALPIDELRERFPTDSPNASSDAPPSGSSTASSTGVGQLR